MSRSRLPSPRPAVRSPFSRCALALMLALLGGCADSQKSDPLLAEIVHHGKHSTLKTTDVPYPATALAAGDSGSMLVSVLCGSNGYILQSYIPPGKGSGVPDMDEAVLTASKQWRCASDQGGSNEQQIPQWLTIRYSFVLDGGPHGVISGNLKKLDNLAGVDTTSLPRSLPSATPRPEPLFGQIAFRCEVDGSVSATRTTLSTGSRDADAALAAQIKAARCKPPLNSDTRHAYAAWGTMVALAGEGTLPAAAAIDPRIFANFDYPNQAIAEGRGGSIVVAFLCASNGTIAKSRIALSSGWKDLDNSVLYTLSQGKMRCIPAQGADAAPISSWGLFSFSYS